MPRHTIADVLAAKKEELIEAWERRVRADERVPEANRLSRLALRNHMPAFVDDLVHALQCSAGSTSQQSRARAVGSGDDARQHAKDRHAKSYSLAAVLREWSHFRFALQHLFATARCDPSATELELVHGAIDEAMAQAALEMQRSAHASLEHTVAEEQQRGRELRDEIALREQLVAVIGHDLRDPLSAIAMAVALLQRHDGVLANHSKLLARMRAGAARMARMIEDMLDMSRIHVGGGLELVLAPLDFHELCAHLVEDFATAEPGRVVELESAGPMPGRGDRDRLTRMLANLVRNALVHGAPDCVVTVDLRGTADEVEIAVGNEGPPIPEHLRATLFEPFRRGDTPSAQRLGLGLFIVAEIVRAHGGSIAVRSIEGEPTTFTVRLPRDPTCSTR